MKWNTNIFITKAIQKYGTLYNYSLTKYIGFNEPTTIICSIHGEFQRTPYQHIHRNIGCGMCGKIKASTQRRKSIDILIDQIYQIHGDRYDCSNINYVNDKTKIELICKDHGSFFISPAELLRQKQGCKQCGVLSSSKSRSWTYDEFVKQANMVHNYKYDYSKSIVINSINEVEIICPTHGSFYMMIGNHIHGKQQCTSCSAIESTNEKLIAEYLTNQNILFFREKIFNGLFGKTNKGPLRYDFYLPTYNLLIEYDGEHHYQPIRGEHNLIQTQINDLKKDEYARVNGIDLLRIPFTQKDHIIDLIEQQLN